MPPSYLKKKTILPKFSAGDFRVANEVECLFDLVGFQIIGV